ncbi:MAG: hypothetical protein EOO36_09825 [Cytophagaceae bacterium]|nr:MAG: hypothetical protein EOO36_09825 [Cytophagaceae bacterium]
MTTADIVAELNRLTVSSSEDYAQLDRLGELTNSLQQQNATRKWNLARPGTWCMPWKVIAASTKIC